MNFDFDSQFLSAISSWIIVHMLRFCLGFHLFLLLGLDLRFLEEIHVRILFAISSFERIFLIRAHRWIS